MSLSDKYFYNKSSSERLGWTPGWFGANNFGPPLRESIKEFQEKHKLTVDGLCGPETYKAVLTHRESVIDEKTKNKTGEIYCNRKKVKLNFPLVDRSSYSFPSTHYEKKTSPRDISQIILHWDATLNCDMAHQILKKRGLSTHFGIGNDGTIYQFLDPQHVAWHAKEHNDFSIGIDLSNAYYKKYQKYYIENGHGKRPLIKDSKINGQKLDTHLGYYPEQIEACKQLIKELSHFYDIPLCTPDKKGKIDNAKKYEGILSHYNTDKGKIDCAGFPTQKVLSELREEKSC